MSKMDTKELQLAANTLRCLAMDEVQTANSGHPGVAMGLADVMAVLWLNHLNVCGTKPEWADRDRFVLSGGHASSLLYATLHLAGFDLSLDDLKQFRQLGARTPGHPEREMTPGVETTTGPLGQGIAAGVGMALAERMLAARFNTEGRTLVDHRTWVTCGDGDLEEGISHEVCSLAGALGLGKLILLYDSNGITIEGATDIAMADDTKRRFESYGWRVLSCDGHDFEDIEKAMRKAEKPSEKPTLVICNTVIGKGSPNKSGSASCHGAPLGADEVRLSKQSLGFDPDQTVVVPEAVRHLFAQRAAKGRRRPRKGAAMVKGAFAAAPALQAQWDAFQKQETLDCRDLIPAWGDKPISTRVASGKILNAIAPVMPWLIGGSADLAPSNMTYLNGLGDVTKGAFDGRNLHFGIRELGMGGILNGLSNHGGLRPADATETAVAWKVALDRKDGPTCLMLSRQNLPVLDRTALASADGLAKGAYVLWQRDPAKAPDAILIASGSEVALALETAQADTRNLRVVSMPSWFLFAQQDEAYRNEVLPPAVTKRVAVEAASPFGWERYIGAEGRVLGMTGWGASGPAGKLAEHFGFTPAHLAALLNDYLA